MNHIQHSALAKYTGKLSFIDLTSQHECEGQGWQDPVRVLDVMNDWPWCVIKPPVALSNAHLIFKSTSPWNGEPALNLECSLQRARSLTHVCDGEVAQV